MLCSLLLSWCVQPALKIPPRFHQQDLLGAQVPNQQQQVLAGPMAERVLNMENVDTSC